MVHYRRSWKTNTGPTAKANDVASRNTGMSESDDEAPADRMAAALEQIRRLYIKEHGEEPSEEFMEDAREELVRAVARDRRDAHREIYEALANE